MRSLNGKMIGQLLGALLIIIAIILAVIQHYNVYNFYGTADLKWYFWGLVAVIGIIGIAVAAWSYMKKAT